MLGLGLQEERQQRAEHLRRQRDRLMEKRSKVGGPSDP